jgi:TolB protein
MNFTILKSMTRILSLSRLCTALLAAVVFSLSPVSRAAAERIYLDIAASEMRKIVVAVPSFVDTAGSTSSRIGSEIADIVARGLEFHGFIQIVDPGSYGADRGVDWKALGADYVVMGKYSLNADTIVIEGSLLDVVENKMLAGRRYKGPAAQRDDMALRLVDALVEEFTGEPGISRTSIAFVSDATGRKEVYLADVLGRKVRRVTRHNHLCVSPRFTPDGTSLAYSSYHRGNQNLYITKLNQSKITRAVSRRNGLNLAPAFSPDGRTMVVTLSKGGSPDLYLMDRKGKIIEQLTRRAGINVSPSFSPDGKSLAFVSDRSGRPQVYIMDMQSRKTRRLTFQGNENAEPSWSPKGDKIVYTGLTGGHYQIFTIPVIGGSPAQVSSGPGDFESPAWSPDGKQIVLSRKYNGRQELYAVFANGKGQRKLFNLKGNQSYSQWSPRVK